VTTKPYYQDNAVTIYHGDCREIVPQLGRFDLLLTDPPYGIDLSSHGAGALGHRAKPARSGKAHYLVIGDKCQDAGVWAIEWAASVDIPIAVFASPWKPWPGYWRNMLVWDKGPAVGGGGHTALCWKRTWELIQIARNGPLQKGRDGAVLRYWGKPSDSKYHIAAKPLVLMAYLVGQLSEQGNTILDPFAGSCTTGRAAKDLGRQCVCIEREEQYCEIGARRMAQEVLPLQFEATEPEPAEEPELGLLEQNGGAA